MPIFFKILLCNKTFLSTIEFKVGLDSGACMSTSLIELLHIMIFSRRRVCSIGPDVRMHPY